jgi:hypothetical protein
VRLLAEVGDLLIAVDLSGLALTIENTDEKSRLTVDLFLSSDDSAEFRCALLMLRRRESIDYLLDYYNRNFIKTKIWRTIYLTKKSENRATLPIKGIMGKG